MRTVWTVPPNIAQTLLESPEIQMFLTSNELPETADDPRQRLAEFTHALGALSRNIGRTFGSVDAANRELFGGSSGTVPVALRLTVLRAIVTEVDDRTPPPPDRCRPTSSTSSARTCTHSSTHATAPSCTSAVVAGTVSSPSPGRRSVRHTNSPPRVRTLPPPTPEADAALRRVRAVYDSGYSVEHFVVADHLLPAADGDHAAGGPPPRH